MAPTTRSKSSTNTAPKSSSPAARTRRERRKLRQESFSTYNYRVLKRYHADLGISRAGMSVMNNMMQDVFDRVGKLAGGLTKAHHTATMGEREIRAGVQLMLPQGTLIQHAKNSAEKAMENYRVNRN
jgi:histone H2B